MYENLSEIINNKHMLGCRGSDDSIPAGTGTAAHGGVFSLGAGMLFQLIVEFVQSVCRANTARPVLESSFHGQTDSSLLSSFLSPCIQHLFTSIFGSFFPLETLLRDTNKRRTEQFPQSKKPSFNV